MLFVRYRTKKMFLLDLDGKSFKSVIPCLPLDAFLSSGTDQERHLRMYVAAFTSVTTKRTVTSAVSYKDILLTRHAVFQAGKDCVTRRKNVCFCFCFFFRGAKAC